MVCSTHKKGDFGVCGIGLTTFTGIILIDHWLEWGTICSNKHHVCLVPLHVNLIAMLKSFQVEQAALNSAVMDFGRTKSIQSSSQVYHR